MLSRDPERSYIDGVMGDEALVVSAQDESGARVAQPSLHPGDVPRTETAADGDLPEPIISREDITDDVMIAAGRLYADMQTQGAENISLQRYSWVIGLLMGTVHRQQEEIAVMRDMLQSAINIRTADADE